MNILGELRKNTKGSLHIRKRSVLALVLLLSVATVLAVVFCEFPESFAQEPIVGGGQTSSFYSFKTSTSPTPTPTPTPDPGQQQNNNSGGNGGVDDQIIALVVVPEFGLGGGLAALATCFAAFTLFIRYKNHPKAA